MKVLKTIIEKQKSKNQHNKEVEITSTFYIREKDEYLWILHNGHAIQRIDPEKTAEEIVDMLCKYRETAIKY